METEVDDKIAKKEQILQMLIPSLRSLNSFKPRASRKLMRSRQRIMRGKVGIKETGVKKDKVKVGAQKPVTGKMMVPNGVVKNKEETNDDDLALTNDQVRQLWKEEHHRRMKEKGHICGVEWSGGLTKEWNTGKPLLKSIAEEIHRDAMKDLGTKDLDLKRFLDNESNMFFKSGKYDRLRNST